MPTTEIDLRNERNGSTFRFFTKDAEIVSDPVTWTETHVSSSGGGGYVHPTYGGHVSAPTVSSKIVEREKYFVKTDDGKEVELKDAVTGRKGHHVTLVYGGIDGQQTYLVATYNKEILRYELKRPRYFGKYFTLSSCIPGLNLIQTKSVGVNIIIMLALMIGLIFTGIGMAGVPVLFIAGFMERKKRILAIDGKLLSFLQSM
ncbi:hypothetical protein HAP94_25885 [Acidithiobacillus ferrivorans]|nr:hypothetical protein [Acidithiobacillus ferrivorans]